MSKKTLYILSHTHWDREWYDTFQNYRFRLVRLMDDLLDVMENDPEYRYFHLDGQTAPLADYLKIRPENEGRLRALIEAGRILIGPWFVMPDEFLVSGESLVRNLCKGIDLCKDYHTDYMKSGYVTDIFGHNAQFPQILRGFGIDNAVLYRGIGDYPKDTFIWEGADGSKITAFKLEAERSYSNFYFALRFPFEGRDIDWDELKKRAADMLARSEKAGVCNLYLMMDGVDHIDADPMLPKIIAFLNESFADIDVRHATIHDYIDDLNRLAPPLETLSGPLYNVAHKGINNTLLKNVLSSMVHLKQSNDRCETLLTGWAEPFDLFAGQCAVPGQPNRGEPRAAFLKEAWEYLLLNHPHDSICGCSISDVHRDNEYRFRQTEQIARRMTDEALDGIVEQVNTESAKGDFLYVLFNPSQQDINGYTTFSLDLPHGISGFFKLLDGDGNEIPYQLLDTDIVNPKRVAPIRRLISFACRETVLLAASITVPQNGYTLLSVQHCPPVGPAGVEYSAQSEPDRVRCLGTMRTGRNSWDNGVLLLEANQNSTLTVTDKRTGKHYCDLLTYEDCGDVGDGWNYVKPTFDSEYLSTCSNSSLAVKSDGPHALVLELTGRFILPKSGSGHHRDAASETLTIVTTVTMVKDSDLLDITTQVDNTAYNHRLRVLFPTGMNCDTFFTQTPFDMQEWPVKKPDWSTYREVETNVNPIQGTLFMQDGVDCFELYTKGLYEVEVCECDRTVALTLFRAFPNEVAQKQADAGRMQREMTFEYAVGFGRSATPARALIGANHWKLGTKDCETGKHPGTLPTSLSFMTLDTQNAVLSALYDQNGQTVLRLYNPSDAADSVTVSFRRAVKGACLTDFLGGKAAAVNRIEGGVQFTLSPRQITTLTINFEE